MSTGHFIGSWVLTNEFACPECGRDHCEMADYEDDEEGEQKARLHCLSCGHRWWEY